MPSSDDALDVGLLSPVTVGHDQGVSDSAIAAALVEVELALARASVKVGIVPISAAEAIASALTGFEPDAAELAHRAVTGGNPVIPLVGLLRARVAESDADAAAYVHRGATSQDIVDSALVLIASRALGSVDAALGSAIAALAGFAEEHRGTLMAARTLTQQSTPTTFGVVAAGWLLGVVDARAGLARLRLPAQLGGASGTLASFVELGGSDAALQLPALFAAELGLDTPTAPWHTRRGAITALGDTLVTVIDSLGVIATDIATLGRTEIAELAEGSGGGSSTMPQKQNPVGSVLIRSASQRAPGLVAELHRSSATAVDQRPDGAWHAEWPALRELLRLSLGASAVAAELVAGLQVDGERMRANLDASGPLIVSERLSLVLAPLIGSARVQEYVDRALDGEDLAALLTADTALAGVDILALLDPAQYVGAADALIDAALHAARA